MVKRYVIEYAVEHVCRSCWRSELEPKIVIVKESEVIDFVSSIAIFKKIDEDFLKAFNSKGEYSTKESFSGYRFLINVFEISRYVEIERERALRIFEKRILELNIYLLSEHLRMEYQQ